MAQFETTITYTVEDLQEALNYSRTSTPLSRFLKGRARVAVLFGLSLLISWGVFQRISDLSGWGGRPTGERWLCYIFCLAGTSAFIFGLTTIATLQLRTTLRRNPLLEHTAAASINDAGLIEVQGLVRSEYPWQSFHGHRETPSLFLLFLANPKTHGARVFIIIPKRVLGGEVSVEVFGEFLSKRIRSHDSAFAVLPPKV
jgi:hypothetical protein